MASKQNGVVPGNVIDFHFTDDVEKDSENLNNLMRDGSMLLVRRYPFNDGYSFTRYDPSNLIFMRFDFSNTSMGEWVKTENPTDTVVEQYHNGEHVPFFVKGSDLFYHKETKEVFLKCEEDWYQVDFTNEKHFALNNNLSITLHNLVTDEVKTLGEMRAWEVVDSDYEPFSSKFLGATDLNTDYMDNFATGDNMYVPSTPGAGKPHSILDMINGTEPSSDEEVESSGFEIKAPLHKYLLGYPVEQIEQLVSNSHKVLSEQEEESVGGYAQDPNDMDSSESDEEGFVDNDSDYVPEYDDTDDDDVEEGEVYEKDKVYEDQFDQEWLDEIYDENRQDLDGNWYTRRQFYDYYGSDDAWDNLDPNIFLPRRYDEIDCEWHSKEEFFQHYGSDCIWDKFHPVMVVKRTMIWRTYWWASSLPKHLRKAFIKEMLETY